jgi:outer membrane protein TolC
MLRRLVVALSIALLSSPSREARAEGPLGLEDAVRLALANNERALKAPLRVEAAEGAVEKARAAFLPSLQAKGSGTLHELDKNSRIWGANGTLQLDQPLLNLPAFPLYAQAKHNREAERFGAAQDKRLVAFDTAKAFLTVLTLEHVVDAARQKLARARANQADAEARAKAQISSTNDVTLAQVDVATAATNVAKGDGDVASAYLNLGFLVGRSVSGPFADPARTVRAAETGVFQADDVARIAEGRRPDVRSAEQKTLALREAAKEPLYRMAPTLGLSGQLKAVPLPLAPDKALDEQASLTLTRSLYDAGVRYADRRTRLAQAESQALDERALRRGIATDIGVALAKLKAFREAYRISAEAVAAARRHTTEVEALYRQGLAKGLDLVDANTRRYDAEVAYENARLQMLQAYLDLRLASGLDPTEDDDPGPRRPAGAGPVEVKP